MFYKLHGLKNTKRDTSQGGACTELSCVFMKPCCSRSLQLFAPRWLFAFSVPEQRNSEVTVS